MDEIEFKLRKKNPITIAHTIDKLVDLIKTKYIERRKVCTSTPVNFPEIDLLKRKCGDDESLVARTACLGLVNLVEEGFLHSHQTMTDFIAAISSTKNIVGIIEGISQLLRFDIEVQLREKKEARSLYGLCSPQHPLIIVMKNRKDASKHVVDQLRYLICHDDSNLASTYLQLLELVFIYVLCNPVDGDESRVEIWNLIVHQIDDVNVEGFLLEILPWLPDQPCELPCALIKLYSSLIRVAIDQNKPPIALGLTPLLIAKIEKIISNGDDPRPYFNVTKEVITKFDAKEIFDYILILLSEIILICPAIYLNDIVDICFEIIKNTSSNILIINMVVGSLLQWLANPSKFLSVPLEKIYEIIRVTNSDVSKSLSSRTYSNKWFTRSSHFEKRIYLAESIANFADTFHTNEHALFQWLEQLAKAPGDFIITIQTFIASVLISRFDDVKINRMALKILAEVVAMNHEMAPNLLSFVLFKVSQERDASVLLVLLKTMPEMAVAKENIPRILHALDALTQGHIILQSLAVDLYTRLWKVEIRCFPYLQKALLAQPSDVDLAHELDIIKAISLREICTIRPEQYGNELVVHLSNILNRSNSEKARLASCYALEGIMLLCRARIVDIVSTWKVLAPKFNDEPREIVALSWCEFLAEILDMSKSLNTNDLVIETVVLQLWQYALTHENLRIASAALRALSKFDFNDKNIRYIPSEFYETLNVPSQTIKSATNENEHVEVLTYIPGEIWVQLLQKIREDAMDAACDLIKSLVRVEIGQYRSGVYRIAEGQGEPVTFKNLPARSVVNALGNYVRLQVVDEQKTRLLGRNVVVPCMKILSENYGKPIPPINWSFLHELYHWGVEERQLCILLSAKQCISSGSALRFIENCLLMINICDDNIKEITTLCNVLNYLCFNIPQETLKQFVEKALKFSMDNSNKSLFTLLIQNMKNVILDEKIDNLSIKAMLLEYFKECFIEIDLEHRFFSLYVDCIIDLPEDDLVKIIKCEVSEDHMRKVLTIRYHWTRDNYQRKNLNWVHDFIGASLQFPSDFGYILYKLEEILTLKRNDPILIVWIQQLIIQVQTTLIEHQCTHEQVQFLCDIFFTTIIVVSSHNHFVYPSKVKKFIKLIPHVLYTIANETTWQCLIPEITEFIFHMIQEKQISAEYREIFQQALTGLQSHVYFTRIWMKCLSQVKING